MSEFETGYQPLGSFYDADEENPPEENIIHVTPDSNNVHWNHIENLDEFFTRVYQYHQRSGFLCMLVQDVLQILQFMFVVLFSTFLIDCVDYDILFYEKFYNHTHKVTIAEAVTPIDECVEEFSGVVWVCLIIAFLFAFFRLIKLIYNIFKYMEIRSFYLYALRISSEELTNMTWHEVQRRLLHVQKEQQMCIHKSELSELDIYHRILRFKNYMVAMVNKSLLQTKYRIPCIGDYTFMSIGFKYNLEMILFWGPWSPFENNWHLKPDYKNYHKRKDLATYLSNRILWIGIANLILSPFIFLWLLCYSFFRYAEAVKREPSFLGSRMWSQYCRLYVRHFNELDHEFNARLNRGYKVADRYMSIFVSPLLVILAKQLAFFAGSILAVFIILTVLDEDFLAVQNVIGAMTILTIVLTISRSCIPDEHMVWCPELLMRTILAQIHYIPDHWKGQAHTHKVRDEFSTFFQYKIVHLIEEVLSPLTTPFLLMFHIRHKALEIVDFYRNFTVEVTGVGDVCSFAQMDIRRHGNPQWLPEGETEANQYQQAEDGKTELSLMHFTLTNPGWKPADTESMFIHNLKEQAQRDAAMLSLLPLDNPLSNSLNSVPSTGQPPGFTSIISSAQISSMMPSMTAPHTLPPMTMPPPDASMAAPATMYTPTSQTLSQSGSFKSASGLGTSQMRTSTSPPTGPSPSSPTGSGGPSAPIRGGLRNAEGPIEGGQAGLLASVNACLQGSTAATNSSAMSSIQGPATLRSMNMSSWGMSSGINEQTLEYLSTEMSFSALYMHELHRHRRTHPQVENYSEMRERALWQVEQSPPEVVSPHTEAREKIVTFAQRLSPQHEEEEEEGLEMAPLLHTSETNNV